MMVTSRQQFSMLLLTQSDSQSFGHGVPFWKTNVPFILPHLSRYYQLNFLKCIITPDSTSAAMSSPVTNPIEPRFKWEHCVYNNWHIAALVPGGAINRAPTLANPR